MDDEFGFDDSLDTGGSLDDIDFDSSDIDGGLDDIDFDGSNIDGGLDDIDFDGSDIDGGLDDIDFDGSNIDGGPDDIDFDGSNIDGGPDDIDFDGLNIDGGPDDIDFDGSNIDGGPDEINNDDIEIDDLQMDPESEEIDESLDFDAENDGYFESIPNEVEPLIMEEEQSENITETNDVVPETAEGDKTPYESLRDYMYEHNYGQMDYPEYSQDPEWQALNEQYTASLENTPQYEETNPESIAEFENDISQTEDVSPVTEEINEVTEDITPMAEETIEAAEDIPPVTEETSEVTEEMPPVAEDEYETGEVVPDVSEEVAEAVPETAEGDKTPYESMRDYMNEHNYGRMDYPEYSQDPEWQALNEQYTASLENTPQYEETNPESIAEFENDISQIETEETPTISEETNDITEDITLAAEETNDVTDGATNELSDESPVDLTSVNDLSEKDIEEIFESWDEEKLSESFENIEIAENHELLDNTLNNFVESNWEKLSLDEQKDSISSLAEYVTDVVGFENPPTIEYYNNETDGDYGGYDSETNTLSINEYMLYDSNEAADTIAHELWHAHQHECAENPQSVRDYQYQYNFDNYISPEMDFESYQDQLLESEARAFAAQFKDRLEQLKGR